MSRDPSSALPPFSGDNPNPFLRYRRWLSPYRLALAAGLPDAAWVRPRRRTRRRAEPGRRPRLPRHAVRPPAGPGQAFGLAGDLWIKDETQNVSGSHKGRHLMGVMLYLRRAGAPGLPLGEGLRARRLAIASCGNAALAAAVGRPRGRTGRSTCSFPPMRSQSALRLGDSGATRHRLRAPRRETGDPCVIAVRSRGHRRRHSIRRPGTGQRPGGRGRADAGLRDGEALAAERALDALYVQVGGGALASALAQGLPIAAAVGCPARRD